MSDAYGMIVFTKSNSCVVDDHKLKNVLNKYEWDNSGAKWAHSDLNSLYIDGYFAHQPQYPTAIPKEIERYELFGDANSFYLKRPEDMSKKDWDAVAGEIRTPVPLERLSSEISPLLKSGWIEIACTASEKSVSVYMEILRIYADGKAYSKRICTEPGVDSREEFSEYAP